MLTIVNVDSINMECDMNKAKPQRHDGRDYLTTAQAARRLGVKEQTLYAYVSRGLLVSTRVSGVPGSLFPVDEIEALSDRGPRRAASGAVERIRTQITLRENGFLYYRGVDVTTLAELPFERVAHLLWTEHLPDTAEFVSDDGVVRRATRAAKALPSSARLVDRMRVLVDVAGACDPLRFDTSTQSIVRAAPALIALVVDGLAPPDAGTPVDSALAQRLWVALCSEEPTAGAVELLNSALVLLADHDLAASTLAVRMAASTRANVYSAIAAGLGVMDGPYHGAATSRAYRFLGDCLDDPLTTLALRLRDGDPIPGFGHVLYDGDPRADFLLAGLRELDSPRVRRIAEVTERIVSEIADRKGLQPNSDFALAALAHSFGMRSDAAEAVFAIARTAGWMAHALEEYSEKGLRFRVPGIYTGIRPHR